MTIKVVVPSLGESIVDATVAQWYKKEGDSVAIGEKLVELETDKVNLDVGAERGGVLEKIERQEGSDVKVGEVLAVINESAESQPSPKSKLKNEKAANQQNQAEGKPTSSQTLIQPAESNGTEKERVTPVARRMAEDMGINPTDISQTRPGSRITKQDIEKFAAQHTPASTESKAAVPEEELQSKSTPNIEEAVSENPAIPTPTPLSEREERQPMSRRRRTIAQRLVEAQHTAAMLTTFNDADMSTIMQLRARRKEEFKTRYGINLGMTSFFVKASILALREFPMVNAEIRGDDIILKHYYDIGVAIGSEEGLVVPVLRDADKLTFAEIEKAIQGYVTKTQEGTLSVEDLRGGTFTITNGGVFGSLFSTPILNTPQVGILGLHRIDERPIAIKGQVEIRPMMYLALSYDHRVIDGRVAVQFLARIKEIVENPDIMLLYD